MTDQVETKQVKWEDLEVAELGIGIIDDPVLEVKIDTSVFDKEANIAVNPEYFTSQAHMQQIMMAFRISASEWGIAVEAASRAAMESANAFRQLSYKVSDKEFLQKQGFDNFEDWVEAMCTPSRHPITGDQHGG